MTAKCTEGDMIKSAADKKSAWKISQGLTRVFMNASTVELKSASYRDRNCAHVYKCTVEHVGIGLRVVQAVDHRAVLGG